MQKLVTIYLDSYAYAEKKTTKNLKDKHGLVEEHLTDYLSDGWKIKQISSFGSTETMYCTTGFIVVMMEKT